jgi:2-desacetyl-2-hydroxyethyl bacteriochlorophyllide A dehydrogenase
MGRGVTARHVISSGPGRLVVEDQAPLVPGPDDVVVRTSVAGVCGSDLAVQRGPFPGRLTLPRVLGHEWSGVVEAVGGRVDCFAVGSRVVAEEILWCGTCRECRRGLHDHCADPREIGFTVDGAFATYLRVPAKACHLLPSECTLEVGALVEPLSVAYNAVHLATGGVAAGRRAMVIGQGPIGTFVALWLRVAGVEVVAAERKDFRRELAQRSGVQAFPDIAQAVREIGDDIDLCVEASGDHAMVGAALSSLRPHGQVVVVSHSTRPAVLDLEPVVLKGLRVAGSCGQVGRNTYAAVLAALRTGAIDPTAIVTHRVALEDLDEVFRGALGDDAAFGKILVTEF